MKQRIETSGAPPAGGPYSQAIATGGLVFCAGQLGIDPATGALVEGGIEGQAERALRNLGAVLEAAGLSYADVVKTTCFLIDMNEFATFNEAYIEAFGDHRPARSTIAVRELPAQGDVEIEAVAYSPRG